MIYTLIMPESLKDIDIKAVLMDFDKGRFVSPAKFVGGYLNRAVYRIDSTEKYICILINDIIFIDHYTKIDAFNITYHSPHMRIGLLLGDDMELIESSIPELPVFQLWDVSTDTYFKAFHDFMRFNEVNYNFEFCDASDEWQCNAFSCNIKFNSMDWSNISYCCDDIVTQLIKPNYTREAKYCMGKLELNPDSDKLNYSYNIHDIKKD